MPSNHHQVTGGVDTHGRTHHGAVIDANGRLLGDQQFPATAGGYRALLAWMQSLGEVCAVGVEGTGTYGAGLARYLARARIRVVEVDRPDRKTRRLRGKSDPIDAISAARSVLSGTASGAPKTRTGPVEALRALRAARRGAVKARVAAINQLHGLIASAPEDLRAGLGDLTRAVLLKRCRGYRIDEDRLGEPEHATRAALRAVARRVLCFDEEIAIADRRIAAGVALLAPTTLALPGVGPQVAAQLLVSVGDNPDRLRNEAALAHLFGAAPLPASSGRRDRHRLNRGGDRQANTALHTIVVSRMKCDQRTRDYVERRTKEGLSKKDIIRCLKRYVVREVYQCLMNDFTANVSSSTT